MKHSSILVCTTIKNDYIQLGSQLRMITAILVSRRKRKSSANGMCESSALRVWSRQHLMPYYFLQTPARSRIDLELRLSRWKVHWSPGSTLLYGRCQRGRNSTWLGSCSLWDALRGLSRDSLSPLYSLAMSPESFLCVPIVTASQICLGPRWHLLQPKQSPREGKYHQKGHDIS